MVKIGSDRHRRRATSVPDSASTLSDAEIAAYYKAHLDDFDRPATAYLSFVALPRLTTAADTAAARARADSVRAEIVGGAPFADVARRESSDSASAATGGDLGEWTKGTHGRGVRFGGFRAAAQHACRSRCGRSSAII